MQTREEKISGSLDWITIGIYAILVLWGWLNIYSVVYDHDLQPSILDFTINSGRQFIWICTALVLIFLILMIDYRFYESFAYIIYGIFILMLLVTLFAGTRVAGAKAWLQIGGIAIQTGEFAKFSASLALSAFMSSTTIKLDNSKHLFWIAVILGLPPLIILLQNDTGSALVFASFVIVLYREGINPTFIVLGLILTAVVVLSLLFSEVYLVISYVLISGFILLNIRRNIKNISIVLLGLLLSIGISYSVDYVITNVLQPHQQNRIKALVDPDADPLGYGWNVTQSKIAIGSGGFIGKGFKEGTQTKFDFVPEQHTDFIFCTIGEEYGWLGTTLLIGLFLSLLYRLIFLAERQRSRFARVYGYCVASILFFHFMINIGMTIGIFPVIGIPLPFFSYGGSSLWSFTILLFIFLNLDANRMHILG